MNTPSALILWLVGVVIVIVLISTAGFVGIIVSILLISVIAIYMRLSVLYEVAKTSEKTKIELDDLKYELEKRGIKIEPNNDEKELEDI